MTRALLTARALVSTLVLPPPTKVETMKKLAWCVRMNRAYDYLNHGFGYHNWLGCDQNVFVVMR